ncbi:unnamed protein product [Protopolystoma xenopodis]|uniref:Uncharacterized protein n=1 Tax=Protopolystoma xenopodis TaxID=117903 RepID=A0A3S5FH20_9PLAT|nr:unnamed protein product [Protopolystoma xenopodis]
MSYNASPQQFSEGSETGDAEDRASGLRIEEQTGFLLLVYSANRLRFSTAASAAANQRVGNQVSLQVLVSSQEAPPVSHLLYALQNRPDKDAVETGQWRSKVVVSVTIYFVASAGHLPVFVSTAGQT